MKYYNIIPFLLITQSLSAQPESLYAIKNWFRNCESDVVKSNYELLYLKFEKQDTISEFFRESDTIYYYREKVSDEIHSVGTYLQKIVDSIEYRYQPPGEYLEEVTYSPIYNYLKSGDWTYYYDDRVEEIEYKNDEIVSFKYPTPILIKQYSKWVNDQELHICTDDFQTILDKQTLTLFSTNYNCFDRKRLEIKSKQNKTKDKDQLEYQLLEDGTMIMTRKLKESRYYFRHLGKNVIVLDKVKGEPADNK